MNSAMAGPSNEVDVEAARRIAIHAQALDGSASDLLTTVQRLGFLQLDPIATVATPQELDRVAASDPRADATPAHVDAVLG